MSLQEFDRHANKGRRTAYWVIFYIIAMMPCAWRGWQKSEVQIRERGMSSNVKVIDLGNVNCYLLVAGDGFILIDTGSIEKRILLERILESVGCKPGKLELILITHGDSDHSGNCAYLRRKYSCKIAMHSLDSGMVEQGDWSWNRKPKPFKFSQIFRRIRHFTKAFIEGKKFEKFRPDLFIDESFDLANYGLKARILHIPGHSKGSIGVLTENGEFYCGDFAHNLPGPQNIDDVADYIRSMEKLKQLRIKIIYPGHGKPFPMSILLKRANYLTI